MVKSVTYQNTLRPEENTPLVTILETRIDTKQSTATDMRGAAYVIDLAKAAFGGTTYPEPGTQWYLKKISGVWTLMARAPRQNPQLNPSFEPSPGDTFIGQGGTTVLVGDVEIMGSLTIGDGTDPDLGSIKLYSGTTAPVSWMICDGSAISRTTYDLLFDLIGTTYGVGDGSTTFNIPDLRERVAAGRKAASTEFGTLGQSGGTKTHTLTSAEIAAHTHAVTGITVGTQSASHTHSGTSLSTSSPGDHQHTVGSDADGAGGSARHTVHAPTFSGAGAQRATSAAGNHSHTVSGDTGNQSTNHNHTLTGSTDSAGSGGSHNNIQPYLTLNFIIKVLPLTSGGGGGGGGATDLDGLTDVVITSPVTNQVLKYNGSVWINTTSPAGATTLDELTDVIVSSPQDRQLIQYNGSSWVNQSGVTLVEGAAATAAVSIKVSADSQERLIIGADGKHNWGTGSATQDTTLYRNGVNILKTDGSVQMIAGQTVDIGASGGSASFTTKRASSTDLAVSAFVSGDTVARYASDAAGKIQWGPGGPTALDTNLYRNAVGILKTDGSIALVDGKQVNIGGSGSTAAFAALRANLTDTVLTGRQGTGTANFIAIQAGGTVQWGDGTAAVDTNLYRNGTNILKTDGSVQLIAGQTVDVGASGSAAAFTSKPALSSDLAVSTLVAGDSGLRWSLAADGTVVWGDGAGANDTNLYRSAANVLKTDDSLVVGANFTVGSVQIDPSGPSSTNVLRYNGTKFVSAALAESDITSLVSDLAAKQPLATLTTKGDLYVATGSATVVRLPVGADTQVLVADSAQAAGVKWGAGGGGGAVTLDDLSDVIIVTPASTQHLRYNGTNWVNAAPLLEDSSDVDLSGAANGHFLRRVAGVWNSTTAAIDDLSDVVITTPASTQHLRYNGTNWVNSAPLFDDSSDVDLTGAANGHFLQRSAGVWVSSTATLDDLSGVVVSGSAVGHILQHNGSNYVNKADINIIGAAAGTDVLTVEVTSDTQKRLIVNGDGKMEWGTGAAAQDTNLYRDSAGNLLRTDDDFWAANLGRGVLVEASITAMSSSIGGTLTVVLSTASATFKANRAYAIELEGGVQPNTANTVTDIRFYKGTNTTTQVTEFFRTATPVLGVAYNCTATRTIKIGGSDVTTAVSIGISASAGTTQLFGSAGAPSILRVVDVGTSTAYSLAPTMS